MAGKKKPPGPVGGKDPRVAGNNPLPPITKKTGKKRG